MKGVRRIKEPRGEEGEMVMFLPLNELRSFRYNAAAADRLRIFHDLKHAHFDVLQQQQIDFDSPKTSRTGGSHESRNECYMQSLLPFD